MAQQRFVSFYHNNVPTSAANGMFDLEKNPMTEVPIFVAVRNFLKQKNIILNTYDIHTEGPTVQNIHWDLPYPTLSNIPIWKSIVTNRDKNVLIATEPPTVNPFNYMKPFHRYFLKVFTWNDALVDNKKYFKFRLPKASTGIRTKAKPFLEKKFLTLMNANKSSFYPFALIHPEVRELYSERIKAIEFFEKSIPDSFSLYGRGWNKPKKRNLKELTVGFKKYATYKGEVVDKIAVLSHFKYCLCFENLTNVNGFITEKIFDCFKARCVPVYWGANDITRNIPKTCFIDFRNFRNYRKLLTYLQALNESTYRKYIENIEKLLADKKFIDDWFEEGFAKFFSENVLL